MSYYRSISTWGPQKQGTNSNKVIAGDPILDEPKTCDCSHAEYDGVVDSLKEPFISSGTFKLPYKEGFSVGGDDDNTMLIIAIIVLLLLIFYYNKN